MAETIENFLFAIASPFAPAAKAFTGASIHSTLSHLCVDAFPSQYMVADVPVLIFAGPALQYLPGLTGFFAANFAVAYIAWGLYGLSGKKRYALSQLGLSVNMA